MSDRDDMNPEDESDDDDDDDESGIDASTLRPSAQSNSSAISNSDLMFPPTPGSWLGSNDHDKEFMALFTSNDVPSMMPSMANLEKDHAAATFESTLLSIKSPLYRDSGSYSLDLHTEGMNANGLSGIQGSFTLLLPEAQPPREI